MDECKPGAHVKQRGCPRGSCECQHAAGALADVVGMVGNRPRHGCMMDDALQLAIAGGRAPYTPIAWPTARRSG